MKTKVFLLLLFGLLIINSCQKKKTEPDQTTTVAQDKQNIKNTFNTTISAITQFKNGDFFQFIVKFLELQQGEIINESWLNKLEEELDYVADFDFFYNNNRFDLSYYSGVYTWDIYQEKWDKMPIGDMVILKFPSDPTKTSNNCFFVIESYSDAPYNVDGEIYYLPTFLKANLKKDNIEILNITLNSTYATNTFPVPINSSIELYTKPYYFNLNIQRIDNTVFKVNSILFKGSNNQITINSELTLLHDDYENLDIENDVRKVKVDVIKNDIAIKGTWDVFTFNQLNNPTIDQLNATMNLVVNHNQNKIGEVKFKKVNNENKLFIFYKDGTNEEASVYYEPFYNDLKSIIEPYFGEIDFNKIKISRKIKKAKKIINEMVL